MQVTQPYSGYIRNAPAVSSVSRPMTLPTATAQYATTQIPITTTSANAAQQISNKNKQMVFVLQY